MQAFLQATLEDPVYLKPPQGWFVDDQGKLEQHSDPKFNDMKHFLCLKRNLFGMKQAVKNCISIYKMD
jgi:hypothetical protein